MKKKIRFTLAFRYITTLWLLLLSVALMGQSASWDERILIHPVAAVDQPDTLNYLQLTGKKSAIHRVLLYTPTSIGYHKGIRHQTLSEEFVNEYQVHQKDIDQMGTYHWMSLASIDDVALSNRIWELTLNLNEVYLITNFEVKKPSIPIRGRNWCRTALRRRPFFEDGDEGFNDALGYFMEVKTSSTGQPLMVRDREEKFKMPQVNVFFKNPESLYQEFNSKEILTWKVLQAMLALPNSTFRQKLVESGLNVEAGLSDVKHKGVLAFTLKANPHGVKASIDSFFTEVNKMHRFDYSTVEQLEFAKKVIRNEWAHDEDKFMKLALGLANFYAYDKLGIYQKRDSLLGTINKVDLMNCIKTYIQNRPFHVELLKQHGDGFDLRNSWGPDACELYFEQGSARLNEEQKPILDELLYTLNLSHEGTVGVVVAKQEKRKLTSKRGEAVISYLKAKNKSMDYKLKVVKRVNGLTPDVSFTYVQNE